MYLEDADLDKAEETLTDTLDFLHSLEKNSCSLIRDLLVEKMQKHYDGFSLYSKQELLLDVFTAIPAVIGTMSDSDKAQKAGSIAYGFFDANHSLKQNISDMWEMTKNRICLLGINEWSEALAVLNSHGFDAACAFILEQKVPHGKPVR